MELIDIRSSFVAIISTIATFQALWTRVDFFVPKLACHGDRDPNPSLKGIEGLKDQTIAMEGDIQVISFKSARLGKAACCSVFNGW